MCIGLFENTLCSCKKSRFANSWLISFFTHHETETITKLSPIEDMTWLRNCSDPGGKKVIFKWSFQTRSSNDQCSMTHLNWANHTTCHDGKFSRDWAHSQFELRHVGSTWQHVAQTVWASCVHKSNIRSSFQSQSSPSNLQRVKGCFQEGCDRARCSICLQVIQFSFIRQWWRISLSPVCFFGSSNRSAELIEALPANLSRCVLASYYSKKNKYIKICFSKAELKNM